MLLHHGYRLVTSASKQPKLAEINTELASVAPRCTTLLESGAEWNLTLDEDCFVEEPFSRQHPNTKRVLF